MPKSEIWLWSAMFVSSATGVNQWPTIEQLNEFALSLLVDKSMVAPVDYIISDPKIGLSN
jgi:hypothetical protein